MSPKYRLVYDAATANYEAGSLFGIGIALTIITAAFLFFPKLRSLLFLGQKFGTAYYGFMFIFAFLFTAISSSATYSTHSKISQAASTNSCKIVEGAVQDFVPMPDSGKPRESFKVQKLKFEYSDYVFNGGFNNSQSHGGPMAEGLSVRICYVASTKSRTNIIARLEILN